MNQTKETVDESHEASSSEREIAELLRQNGNSESDTAEYKKQKLRHEKLQDWTDTIYSLVNKLLITGFGIVLLWHIARNDNTIKVIEGFYTTALEYGNIGLVAIVIALFLLVRSFPILILETKRMLENSKKT